MFATYRGKVTVSEEFSNLEPTPEGHLILEFTEEESDTAIAMFGCDCVKEMSSYPGRRLNPAINQYQRLVDNRVWGGN